jgi:rubredoxin
MNDTTRKTIDHPALCPDCRAGRHFITSENVTPEHSLRLTLKFTCERCGWSDERTQS